MLDLRFGWAVGGSTDGQCKVKTTTLAGHRIYPNLAIVCPNNFLAKRKTDAIAFLIDIALQPEPIFKDQLPFIGGNAGTIVTNTDLHFLRGAMQDGKRNNSLGWGVLDRIIQKIGQHLADALHIGIDRW